jgi:3-oxoacyl-[acyl-carrier-protein] synthase II
MTRTRVAITGLGVKAPAGSDLATYWSTIAAGQPTAAKITSFDTSDLAVGFACEVRDFDAKAYLGAMGARRADRATQLGFAAATDALADTGSLRAPRDRCAVVVGTGIGGLATHAEASQAVFEHGPGRVNPFVIPMLMPNATAALVAMHHGFTGPNFCITTACAAGGHAIGEGARLIREGDADVVVAGGTEAIITPLALSGFARLGALSRHTEPARASRPFDVDRDGFVMGEGAAFLVLERWSHALRRHARIWGELLGYGRNADAYHLVAPSPDGVGAMACMNLALSDARLLPDEVGHVNAHGTSTQLNDATEATAISKVFGPHAVPVTSTKGVTGHLIGAAGAAEAVASLLALEAGVIPPTANVEHVDEALPVDLVCGAPRTVEGAPVLSASYGFGGHNAAIVLGPA